MTDNYLGNDVIVRRQWDRDALAIWFVNRKMDNSCSVAKPLKLKFVEHDKRDHFQLPEPTLVLPGRAMKEFYQRLTEQLEMNGERFLEARSVLKAQDQNLNDLRKCLDRTFGLLEQNK